jgi:hypothetical protein
MSKRAKKPKKHRATNDQFTSFKANYLKTLRCRKPAKARRWRAR